MTHIANRDVVVLAPEEWHRIETPFPSQDILRRHLPLALCHHEVLNADVIPGEGIGPARDIACGVDTGRGRLQVLVDAHTAVHGEPGVFSQRNGRPDTNTEYHDIGFQAGAVTERRLAAIELLHGLAEMETHTLRLVKCANEGADLRSHHAFERLAIRRHDVDLDAAGTQ